MMATDNKDFMTQMFDCATDTFQKSMQTGMKMQEQAMKFWSNSFGANMMNQAFDAARECNMGDMQKRSHEFFMSTIETMRSGADAMNRMNIQALDTVSQFMNKTFNGVEKPASKAGASK